MPRPTFYKGILHMEKISTITPLKFAKAQCANMEPDGSCAGARFNDALQPLPGKPLPVCALAERKPCQYFKDCVLPGVANAEVIHKYRIIHGGKIKPHKTRQCPDCGAPLLPHKRICEKCRIARRKTAFRKNYHKRVGNYTV